MATAAVSSSSSSQRPRPQQTQPSSRSSQKTQRPQTQQTQQGGRSQAVQQQQRIAEQQRAERTRDLYAIGSAPTQTARPNFAQDQRVQNAEGAHAASQVKRGIEVQTTAQSTTQTSLTQQSTAARPKPEVSEQTRRDIDTLANQGTSGRARSGAWQRLRNDVYNEKPGVADAIADRLGSDPDSAGKGTISLRGALESPARQGVQSAQKALDRARTDAQITRATSSSDPYRAGAEEALRRDLNSSDPQVRQRVAGRLGEVAKENSYEGRQAREILGEAGSRESLGALAQSTGEGSLGGYEQTEALKSAGPAGLDALKREWGNLTPGQRQNLEGVLQTDAAKAALNNGDADVARMMGDVAMNNTTTYPYAKMFQDAGNAAGADQLARLTGHPSGSSASLAGSARRDMGQTGALAATRAWDGASDAQKVNLLKPLQTKEGVASEKGREAMLEAAGSDNPALAKAGLEALRTSDWRANEALGAEKAGEFRQQAFEKATETLATAKDAEVREKAKEATNELANFNFPGQQAYKTSQEAYGQMMKAASHPDATAEGKAELQKMAQDTLKSSGTSPNIVDMQKTLASGTPAEQAEVLANASWADMSALNAGLEAQGGSVSQTLEGIRQSGEQGDYDRALDNVARTSSDQAGQALKQAAIAGDSAALERFADRGISRGGNTWATHNALAKADHPEAAKALAGAAGNSSVEARRAADQLKQHSSQKTIDKATSDLLSDPKASTASKEAAATIATRAGSPEQVQQAAEFRRAEAQKKIDAAQKVMDDTEGRVREAQEKLGELKAVREGLKEEGIKVPAALDNTIKRMEKNLETLMPQREAAAKEVTDYLGRSDVRESLGNLSTDKALSLMDDAGKAVGSTQAGMEFGRDVVAKELGKPEVKDPFFKTALAGAGKVATLTDRSMSAVNRYMAGLAMAGSKKYAGALAHASGMKMSDIQKFAQMDPSARNTSGLANALGKVGSVADKVSKGLDLMNAGISVANAVQNPSDKRAWMDAAKDVATAARNFTALGSKAFVGLTAITGPLTAITGSMDFQRDVGNADWHSAGGNAAVGIGGGMATAGVIMSATGVGAVAGVPLMVAGGIISAGGAVYSHFFGDGWAEARAKELGYIVGDGQRA